MENGLFYRGWDEGRGFELWMTDGTVVGTHLVLDGASGPTSGSPQGFVEFIGGGIYRAFDELAGEEIWLTDGTMAGTFRLIDLWPGTESSSPGELTALGPAAFFTANDGVAGRELWRTDGTAAGTNLVADIRLGSGSSAPGGLAVVGTKLFFNADDGSTGRELWSSDSTTGVTGLVVDINVGPNGSDPVVLGAIAAGVVFVANDGIHGRELWITDGIASGTSLLADLWPGPMGSQAEGAVVSGGVLYLTAETPAGGREVWRTDGTPAGTTLLRDIAPGSDSSSPGHLTLFEDAVYFMAKTAAGVDAGLWRTDGTEAGTVELVSLDGSDGFFDIESGARELYIADNNAMLGNELWRSDGTSDSTKLVSEILPGVGSSLAPFPLVESNGQIYFLGGHEETFGLWVVSSAAFATSEPLADGTWYAHVCAVDAAGNEGPVATGGPYVVDSTAPTGLVVSSPTHSESTWSNDVSIDFTWSGATDANGIVGYSLLFDQLAVSEPDATIDQAGVGFTGTASPDGSSWYFHIRACDAAGNCGATVHAGPYWIDTAAPSAPGAITSSHDGGQPTTDPTIDAAWVAATDPMSGVSFYRYAFTTSPTAGSCASLATTTAVTSASSGTLGASTWYVHVCAVDAAGNTGSVVTGGPYLVAAGGVSLVPSDGIVTTESGGAAQVAVTLLARPTAPVTVSFLSNDPTEGSAGGPLTFTTSDWNQAQNLTVIGVDDTTDDGDIIYTVSVAVASSDPVYDALSVPVLAAVNLDDDDAVVSLSLDPPLLAEAGGGSSTLTATLDRVALGDVDITLAFVGSATLGNDYTVSTAAIHIPNGEISGTVSLTVQQDVVPEGTEVAEIQVATISGAVEVGGDARAWLSILDDDQPAAIFSDGFESGGLLEWDGAQSLDTVIDFESAARVLDSVVFERQVDEELTLMLAVREASRRPSGRWRVVRFYDADSERELVIELEAQVLRVLELQPAGGWLTVSEVALGAAANVIRFDRWWQAEVTSGGVPTTNAGTPPD